MRSTKTRHHDGCAVRYVPIRDVAAYLRGGFGAASDDVSAVVTGFSSSNNNLGSPLRKILAKAGLVPWPQLFQYMRASGETQWLKEGHRADLVANWTGHSVKVQNDNCVQHTQDDIDSFNAQPNFQTG